jgi:hypothetical protein
LIAFGDGVVALAFSFHRAVVKHECSERVHRLTAREIAAILDERESPVTYETESSVGPE